MFQTKGFRFRPAGFLVTLIFSAFIGNYFSIPLFFRVDFLFGSIATLIVLYFYGVSWGILTSLLASGYTYFLWGHPYAIIVFGAETAFVGFLVHQKRLNLILSVGIYWLFLGMPLVWLFYNGVMHMDVMTSVLIMFKQSVNGIFNALIASLIISALQSREFFKPPGETATVPFRNLLFNLILALILLPAVVQMTFNGREELKAIEAGMSKNVQELSQDIRRYMRSWYKQNMHAVMELAEVSSDMAMIPSEMLQTKVEMIKRGVPDFLNMYVADAEAKTIAFFPQINEKGESTIGLDFSDRPYFKKLKATHLPVVSKVFMGRGGIFSPIVTVSAPIMKNGRFSGYALAALDLGRIKNSIISFRKEYQDITLVDSDNRVMASTIPEREFMQVWNLKKKGVVVPKGDSVYQWFSGDESLPVMLQIKQSYYVTEVAVSNNLPWKLIIEESVAPHQHKLYSKYVFHLFVTILLVVVAFIIAPLISRRFALPLTNLSAMTTDLVDRGNLSEQKDLQWPKSIIFEIESLVHNFQSMISQQEKSFLTLEKRREELHEANDELIKKIDELENARASLQQSEQKYRAVVEDVPALLCRFRPDGTLTFVNENFCRFYKKDFDDLIGTNFFDAIPQKYRERVADHFKTLDHDRPMATSTFQFVSSDGTPEWQEWTDRAIMDEQSDVIEYQSLGRDITKLRRSEEEKRKLESQLQYAQRMESIGTLAGGIAHNFNNLLMGILGNASMMLLETDADNPNHERLKTIEKLVQNGSELTKQLLGYAREGQYEIKSLNLNRLVEETSNTFGATKKEIRVHQDFEQNLLAFKGDQDQIKQALLNLYVNAAEAMSTGGDLYLKTKNVSHEDMMSGTYEPKPGQYLMVTIRDTGTGIGKEELEHIFEPFFTTKGLAESTGLGLASVYGTVKSHGGYIEVDSELDFGTTFSIYLPAIAEKLPVEKKPPREIREGKETVLFVDDEEMVLDIGKQLLEKLGYEVMVASNGNDAIKLYQENQTHTDMVLLDMIMPDMGGGEVYDRLKKMNPEVKVLLSSGYSIEGQATEILNRGCDGFIQKPFDINELSQKMREILEKD